MSFKLLPPTPISMEHELDDFDSGEFSLNEWLKKRAFKNQVSGGSRCFVLCKGKKVLAYYTLSAGAIIREVAPKKMQRNTPDPLPVLVLGRLAVHVDYQNKGLGTALLRDAMIRATSVASDAGVFAILVHALSEQAKRFYLSCGFVESPLQSMTLFMTLETVRSILIEPN